MYIRSLQYWGDWITMRVHLSGATPSVSKGKFVGSKPMTIEPLAPKNVLCFDLKAEYMFHLQGRV